MANDWIIDVLADLRQYALRNNYIALAEQLDDAIVVAAGELICSADPAGDAPARPAPGVEAALARRHTREKGDEDERGFAPVC
ncbi:hypothetical protein ACQ5SO_00640 [Rhodovulum sp. DZ06]|uniref:hypothetical protein n=1 Tax=Rhodovulum sp. DZ06 TaxID=3425126 RepID=UPI003D3357C9